MDTNAFKALSETVRRSMPEGNVFILIQIDDEDTSISSNISDEALVRNALLTLAGTPSSGSEIVTHEDN